MTPNKPKRPFVYRFVFYTDDDIERARQKGPDALDDLRIRDTYLKMRSEQMGVPLVVAPKDPKNPRAKTRIGDWSIVDQDLFAQISTSELLGYITELREHEASERAALRSKDAADKRKAKAALIWHRPKLIQERYEVIDGRLHERRYRTTIEGGREFETSPHPVRSTSVRLEGERLSVPFVINWLLTTHPEKLKPGRKKGSGKPRYKAQIRIGSVVKHLGMFDSVEARDHAVRVAKVNLMLGLSVYPSP
jgi:hypothetical protein